MAKSSVSFKILLLELSSHRGQVRDEPQIYPGRNVAVDETEGMSTPTEERGDLLIRDSGRAHYESRCTVQHSSETGSNLSFSRT